MNLNLLRLRSRRIARTASALALSLATVPLVLGALAGPSAAATSSGNSAVSAQQVVAEAECDIAWLEYDVAYIEGHLTVPPTCAPVPAGVQQSFSTLEYDLCLVGLHVNGGHGFCVPPAAATNSGTSSLSVQQLVATVECDVGWLVWDLGPYNLGLPGAPTPPPFCDPVPSQLAGL
jgi:hypothetical protein